MKKMMKMYSRYIPNGRIIGVALLITAGAVSAAVRLLFLPFDDNVKLKEAWDLSVDVPRWYTQTIDTIAPRDTSIVIVPFDSVAATLAANGWKRSEYLKPQIMVRLAARFGADYVVHGTVTEFAVMKRTANTDAAVNASSDLTQVVKNTRGSGGLTLMGGLQSYTASCAMTIDYYSGASGSAVDHQLLSTKEKDAGFKIYAPFQLDNPEMNFYNMTRSAFGSGYFQKCVPGYVMKSFSLAMREKIKVLSAHSISTLPIARQFIEGKILERSGSDVYINLGSGDNLIQGEKLVVLKPDHPIRGEKGDTLGWAETEAGSIEIRYIKASHFSQGIVTRETDPLKAGWTVRVGGGPQGK